MSSTPMQDDSSVSGIQPRVIPRQDHPISRKDIDREALKVLYRLRDAGFTAYLVGGGVRDLYLGKKPKDFDISTDARPGQLRKVFRNSRLIGKRFRLVQVFFFGGKIVEVSTFRCLNEHEINGEAAAETEEEILAANNTFGSPAEDAFRRDLTINSLFYDITTFSIIDYTGGVNDLNNGIIRLIGEADRRVIRDPVRMLRVIRHAARNGFRIDETTWQAITRHRDKLKLCPISRIRDELFRDIRSGALSPWADIALNSGIFTILLPKYETVLARETWPANREWMLALFRTVDRLHAAGSVLAEDILFSILLLPWAQTEYDILDAPRKGPEAFRFARELRTAIDESLDHLQIKKSVRESMALILANLSHLEHCDRLKQRWPKWLSRKSYFRLCRLTFRIIKESRGGPAIDVDSLHDTEQSLLVVAEKTKPARHRGGQRHRGRRGPSATVPSNGGIFGLKK